MLLVSVCSPTDQKAYYLCVTNILAFGLDMTVGILYIHVSYLHKEGAPGDARWCISVYRLATNYMQLIPPGHSK